MDKCDVCGKTICAADEQVYRVETEIEPCPEAPYGIYEETVMCERCYLRCCEGLGMTVKEELS